MPTALVTKGPLKVTVHATGELRAGRTMTLVTPPVGGMLRIVQLKTTGMPVKSGEIVMEFDPADQVYALEQAKSELAEAEQEIVKMKADADVQKAQDDVALLTARFDVRRGELDASGNELIAAIDAQKNVLTLEEAKRRLAQLEEDVKSRAATNQASLAVVQEKRNKALLGDAARAADHRQPGPEGADRRHRLGQGEPRRPAIFFGPGMVIPEYREGDTVWPGRPVADVIETGKMEVRAKIAESDRANLTAGQPASLYVDALPGETFVVKVGALSGLASRAQWFESATVTRQFDVTFQFDKPDPRLKAGSSVRARHRGQGDPRRAARAAPGGAREERQDARLREGRRPLRAARGQGRAPHREPRRDRRPVTKGRRWRSSIRPRRGRPPTAPRRRCPRLAVRR